MLNYELYTIHEYFINSFFNDNLEYKITTDYTNLGKGTNKGSTYTYKKRHSPDVPAK